MNRPELLDSGINYAANQTTDNPLLYPFFGLAGFFKGTYSRLPYYFKVREYGDFESRDLWEYNLNLSDEEVEMLTAHVWELGNTYFDYFYLTENCSYHMLTALEAAAPRLELSDKLPFWIIPGDTVQVLFKNEGLVHSVNYRPSLRSQFFARSALLTAEEKKLIRPLAKSGASIGQILGALPRERKILVLEAANDYLEFTNPELMTDKKSGPLVEHKHQLLSERATLGVGPVLEVKMPYEGSPDSGHPSMRSGIQFERRDSRADFIFEHRFALHDFLDPPRGYAPHSTLEFGRLALGYAPDEKKLRLDRAYLISVETINPVSAFQKGASWGLKLGADRQAWRPCAECLAAGATGTMGYAFSLTQSQSLLFKAAGIFDFVFSSDFNRNLNLNVGPKLSLIHNSLSNFSFDLSTQYLVRAPFRDGAQYAHSLEVGWSFIKNTQLRLRGEINKKDKRWGVGFFGYY